MERIRGALAELNIMDLLRAVSVVGTLIGLVASLYLLLKGDYFPAILIASSSIAPTAVIAYARRRKGLFTKTGLDLSLVTAITHMYCLSMGDIGPEGLVKAIAENREYGAYSRVFKRILQLATGLGYGFTRAIGLVARTVRPPLRDILIRLSEAMASRAPEEHLSLEMTTLAEEYSGEYERMVESMKVVGGIYASVISISALAVMVSSLLTIFLENNLIPVLVYMVAVLVLAMMSIALKVSTPDERLVYIGESPPRLYSLFRLSLLSALGSLAFPIVIVMGRGYEGIPYMLISAGGILLVPGLLAYRLESYVSSLDRFYPTFIKALGENLSSTTDFRSALSYVLHMELGPLKEHAQRALNRIKAGVRVEKALWLMASEVASYQVHMLNSIFVEAFRVGSRPLDVGKILSSFAIKVLELRNKRRVVTKSFEIVLVILQPIVVALLVILTTLAAFFSQTITQLPYFEWGNIPVLIVKYGVMGVIIAIAVLNSLSINLVRGGFRGTSLLYAGILLLESGFAWIGASKLMDTLLGQFAGGIELPF